MEYQDAFMKYQEASMEYQEAVVEYLDHFIVYQHVLVGMPRSPFGVFWGCFGLGLDMLLAMFWV